MSTTSSPKTKDFFTVDGGYFKAAFGDAEKICIAAETQLVGLGVEFDSMVAIGLSGVLVLPILARHFDVPFLALRKPDVRSHDSYSCGQFGRGTIGKRWILVDDFVCTGETVLTAKRQVANMLAGVGFSTEYVGTYCYQNNYNEIDKSYAGKFIDSAGNGRCVRKIDTDGHVRYVDYSAYNYIYRSMQLTMASDKPTSDIIGATVKLARTNYTYEQTLTLEELVAMAVHAHRELTK